MMRFGIEIELAGDRYGALRAIKLAGISARDSYGFSEDHWTVKGEGYSCFEVCSPPLDFDSEQSLDHVAEVLAILKRYSHVTEYCAIHVHVELADADAIEVARLSHLFVQHQDAFYRLATGDRGKIRDSAREYALPVTHDEVSPLANCTTQERIRHAWRAGRYKALNLNAWWSKGTVEFRLFNTSLDSAVVRSYVSTAVTMVRGALERRPCNVPAFPLGSMLSGEDQTDVWASFATLLETFGMDRETLLTLYDVWHSGTPVESYGFREFSEYGDDEDETDEEETCDHSGADGWRRCSNYAEGYCSDCDEGYCSNHESEHCHLSCADNGDGQLCESCHGYGDCGSDYCDRCHGDETCDSDGCERCHYECETDCDVCHPPIGTETYRYVYEGGRILSTVVEFGVHFSSCSECQRAMCDDAVDRHVSGFQTVMFVQRGDYQSARYLDGRERAIRRWINHEEVNPDSQPPWQYSADVQAVFARHSLDLQEVVDALAS